MTVIVRKSLTEELVARLRDMIIAGALKAGQKVPEAELCAQFSVSRTPLREALKMLAAEGLVVLTLNRGATIAKITQQEIDELFPIIGALEALAGEAACARMTARDLDRLERLHRDMRAEYERGDWLGYSKLNRTIHETIFALSGNTALAALYQQLLVRIHAVRFVARKSPERWVEAIADHEEIMSALRARDGERLARVLRQHLVHKAGSVQEAL
jgi:DNA-binding GntR family transcriptional regulator